MSENLPVTQQNYGFLLSDPSAIAAAEAAKARIQAAYVIAVQKPRDEDQARARILKACRRPEFAEAVEFSKPIGDKQKITGPSIRFAEVALREWGNVLTETQILYEDDQVRRSRITCLDLQNNTSFGKEIQVRKTVERRSKRGREDDVVGERKNTYGETVYILRATDDELQIKEAALVSKAIRNEGIRLLPADIVSEARKVAKETIASRDKADPDAAKKAIVDNFVSIGVWPKDLVEYLKHSLDTVSPAELQDLRGVYRAIRDGEATWKDYIAAPEAEAQPASSPKTKDMYQPQATLGVNVHTEDTPPLEPPPEPPQSPPSLSWNPLDPKNLMERYKDPDKVKAIKDACLARGIAIKDLKPREAHTKLLEFVAEQKRQQEELAALKAADLVPEAGEEADTELGHENEPLPDEANFSLIAHLRHSYDEATLKAACQVAGFAYSLEALSLEALRHVQQKAAGILHRKHDDGF